MQTQYSKLIKVLQSDRGGEYLLKEFDSHHKVNGTIRSLTVHNVVIHQMRAYTQSL